MTSGSNSKGVAIVGIACRFPGAADHRGFWGNLREGVESITALTDGELIAAGTSAESLRDPSYVKATPLLPDCDLFDAAFFEYSPREARLMDPQQRLLLETAWEAFEDAGHRPGDTPGPVGVYVATGGVVSSYLANRLSFSSELPGYTGGIAHIGNDKDFPSTRISYKLNLTGPSINVQTACSSSLVATHLACQAIVAGECDWALAGAATVRIPQHAGHMSVKGGILSPDGHCRAFDADAQGTIFGSGVGLVLLKDLSRAIADRDNIYAVIRGSAVNNDGARKVSYTASSVAAQSRAMVEAMVVAGVSPDQIGYVECHGTGTVVGDPLEIDALTKAFRTATNRRGFCAVGSVKTNIGHLEQTAGVAALIKTALTLKNREIPASLHFDRPNPKIDFDESPFFVNASSRDWHHESGPRFAAVNSLGLGGTNAFAVLEEAPLREADGGPETPPIFPFTFSGKTRSALRASMERHRSWISQCPGLSAPDLSFTLTSGRTHFTNRSCVLAGSLEQLQSALTEALATGEEGAEATGSRRLGFLFSGQGSQYAGMGKELYRSHPVFRVTVDRCAGALSDSLPRPLLEALFGEEDALSLIHETAFAQPALFVVQAALADLLRSWGVVPDVVLGHSVGEFAAAYCAGVYTLEDCLRLIADRARLMQALPRQGTMASIFADEATVAKAIEQHRSKRIAIAALNAPENTVISGDRDLVDATMEILRSAGVRCQQLTVSHAFHSPLIQPAIEAFAVRAASVPASPPKIPWISTATGASLTAPVDAQYWYDHGLNPVRFADGVKALSELGVTDFVELGPGGTLIALARQCVRGGAHAWLGSLDNRRGDWNGLMTSLAEVYRRGHEIDWDGFNRPYRRSRVSAPTYPFERQRFWLDNDRMTGRSSRSWRFNEEGLAGERLRSALPESQFEARYGLNLFPYLDDHRIYGMPVLPMTAAIAALCDAVQRHFGTDAVALDNFQYRDALALPEAGERIVQAILTPVAGMTAECQLASIDAEMKEGWRTHIVCLAQKDGVSPIEHRLESIDLRTVKQRCATSIPVDHYYQTLRRLGLEYGPSFRGIEALHYGGHEVLARVVMPEQLAELPSFLHPALLDACLHTYTALVEPRLDFDPSADRQRCCYLPIDFERFDGGQRGAREVWVHSVRRPGRESADKRFTSDISIYANDGDPIAQIRGLSLKLIPPEIFGTSPDSGKVDWLYQAKWTEIRALSHDPDIRTDEPAGWLILADRNGVGSRLADLLRERGDLCRVAFADSAVGSAGDRSWSDASGFSHACKELVAGAAAESRHQMRGIVNLWSLDLPTGGMTVDQLESGQRAILGSALSLLQAVVEFRQAWSAPPRLWFATRNAVAVSPDDNSPSEPVSAALWGFGRSAALEHPQIWGGLLDFGAEASSLEEAARLLTEILRGDGDDQVALRNGRRYAPRLVRAQLPTKTLAKPDAEGTYLITGGLGALGIETARWLVSRRGVKHLVLASRRGDQDPNASSVANEISALGAEVRVVSADITKEADVRELLKVANSPLELRGIFHCAGLLDDGILLQMSWAKLWRVMAPKVIGGWLLSELSRGHSLECFVVFSSILSLTGSAGQANYSAANAFLDALAVRRRAQGLPALALNFGPWAESGLATESGEKGRQIWRARGTEYIPVTLGVEALDAVVGSDFSHAVVTITQWPVFLEQFATTPSFYSELRKEGSSDAPAARLGTDRAALRLKLKNATPTERRDMLVDFVLEQAMKTLGLASSVDPERPLREFGLDSLMSVTLLNRLEAVLGVKVSAAKLIQGPSVRQLADDLSMEWAQEADEVVQEAKPEPAAGPKGGWLIVAERRPRPRFRLFCFPFAGGGSAIYRTWSDSLDKAIEVVAIEPPGRLGRIEEKPISNVNEFVDKLIIEMHGFLDCPFAFFGHCLGGLTMYETARRLIHSTSHRPRHLFVSGARPPDQIEDTGPFEERLTRDLMNLAEFRINVPPFAQSDDIFGRIIRHFNIQATDQLLDNPELRSMMLPVIRAEFRMASNYEYESEPPWNIPITCFAARDDPYVSRRHALGWGYFTDARLQVHIREGAHFAVVDDAAFIQSVINRELLGQ
jgi:acyl transferase domain-containing protein/surfactin synthase thioesterase subunit/acyl carrier protein